MGSYRSDERTDSVLDKAVGPMEFGCILFAGPFFLLVAWIVLAVIFNWR